MVTEGYVSFEAAKLLKEKGFECEKDSITAMYNEIGKFHPLSTAVDEYYYDYSDFDEYDYVAPTLQMAMKWLREVHNVLIISDYDYECTDKSYCYKIYRLGENGKPERVPIEGVRYDTLGEPHTEIVAYRDYKRSYFDYETYEEACEAGIKYCLENLI